MDYNCKIKSPQNTSMTTYGICNIALIPLRAQPSHKSEMVSQLLFGDSFEILDQKQNWSLVKMTYDEYEGWVDSQQVQVISPAYYEKLLTATHPITDLSTHAILMKLGHDELLHLLPGSTLPLKGEEDIFSVDGTDYLFLGQDRITDSSSFTEEVEEVARFYLNAPYLWGGRSLFGIDCSGFTQMVYKHFGRKIARDAYQQATIGDPIHSVHDSRPGDLAFFDAGEGRITHVGIVISDSKIIHASGHVKIDKLDEKGIFNVQSNEYTHQLRIIKRLFA